MKTEMAEEKSFIKRGSVCGLGLNQAEKRIRDCARESGCVATEIKLTKTESASVFRLNFLYSAVFVPRRKVKKAKQK